MVGYFGYRRVLGRVAALDRIHFHQIPAIHPHLAGWRRPFVSTVSVRHPRLGFAAALARFPEKDTPALSPARFELVHQCLALRYFRSSAPICRGVRLPSGFRRSIDPTQSGQDEAHQLRSQVFSQPPLQCFR